MATVILRLPPEKPNVGSDGGQGQMRAIAEVDESKIGQLGPRKLKDVIDEAEALIKNKTQ